MQPGPPNRGLASLARELGDNIPVPHGLTVEPTKPPIAQLHLFGTGWVVIPSDLCTTIHSETFDRSSLPRVSLVRLLLDSPLLA